MDTIEQQLIKLANIKEAIRQAINDKGVTVASDAPFSDYATAIGQISGSGGDTEFIKLIERSGTGIILPSGITKIGVSTFSSTPYTIIDIPSGVTIIETSGFSQCSSLTRVDIPSSVTSMGLTAFSGCTNLSTIICRATTPPTVKSNTFGSGASNYTGVNSGGSNKLYVPNGCSSAYSSATGGWATLFDSTKCNFTIAELDANGNIPT